MYQVSFTVKSGCINIFRMDYTDRDGDVVPVLIFIAGDTQEELLQVPDSVSEEYNLSEQVEYYIDDLEDLYDLMDEDDVGTPEMRKTILGILQDSDYEPRCFEIEDDDFQAVLVIAEKGYDGKLRDHWDPVNEADAFERLSIIANV